MIEDVKGLQPELQHFAFVQRDLLLQRHVEVLQARAVEETARDIAQRATDGGECWKSCRDIEGEVLKAVELPRGLWLSSRLPGVKCGVSMVLLLMPLGKVPSSELSVLL